MGRRSIRCSHTHGEQNLFQAIAHSCNTYFINTGLIVESDLIARYARMLGLGQPTKIDLPSEEAGQIPSKRQRRIARNRGWYPGDTANLSIGQGEVLTTPVQLANMMATIARGGEKIQPHLIRTIHGKPARHLFLRDKLNLKQENIDVMVNGMTGTVEDNQGTARALAISGLKTYGKTGTAQTVVNKKHNSWFAGVTQSEKGKYAFCVYLEHGGSSYYAVRAAREVLLQMQKEELL